jgi:aminoglycoside phosphotransferase (APT) family kinase protein
MNTGGTLMQNDSRGFLPLPIVPEKITAAWMQAALRVRTPGVVVEDAHVEDVIEGTSTKIRVRLRYATPALEDRALPSTLIVKGGFQAHSPSMAFMYESEMRFYRELAPRLALNVPRSWFTASDPDSHQSIVIMDDLCARAVTFCSMQRPHSYAEAQAFLDALARHHALWWGRPELHDDGELGWVVRPDQGASRAYQQHYLAPERWQHYIAQPRGAAVPKAFHDAALMQHMLDRLWTLHRAHPCTLNHGDTHPGNLFIETDGRPGFFDAQVCRAAWFYDVPYHLIASLDILDRRRWERPLLAHYLARLAAYGVSDVPVFDDAFELYRRSVPWGLFVFLINETRFQTEATNTGYAARFGAAAADLDVLGTCR